MDDDKDRIMSQEYRLMYMRIQEENFDPKFEVFIPDVELSYIFEKDKPKDISEAEGSWLDINVFSEDGWELFHIIPKNLYLLGLFKRNKQKLSKKINQKK